jgi:hypothetical protein
MSRRNSCNPHSIWHRVYFMRKRTQIATQMQTSANNETMALLLIDVDVTTGPGKLGQQLNLETKKYRADVTRLG